MFGLLHYRHVALYYSSRFAGFNVRFGVPSVAHGIMVFRNLRSKFPQLVVPRGDGGGVVPPLSLSRTLHSGFSLVVARSILLGRSFSLAIRFVTMRRVASAPREGGYLSRLIRSFCY